MNTNKYKVIITPTAYKEIRKIYDYIAEELYAGNAAKRLMKKIEEQVHLLKHAPKIHTEIGKIDELKRNYRKIVINNYVILYTIDDNNMIVYISHMYYSGKNYIDYI
ncbi:MAG: type II toxin-antitoxin system RelE/ParE family toxin [Clostridia bacterium]|nr:type II toxin-antitoxin system RelE/ParE family toxin [Clostridia bacterium]